jgi:carbon storage regulator
MGHLILTRKIGEVIYIGSDVEIEVIEAAFGKARIGIRAPDEIEVDRSEVRRAKERDGRRDDAIGEGET